MCHQSVGLIQSVIERAGIPTASISVLREVTERVSPPRALFADFPLGYPLGAAHDPAGQIRVLRAMLTLLTQPVPPPLLSDFVPGA
jgi:hypothetical protein